MWSFSLVAPCFQVALPDLANESNRFAVMWSFSLVALVSRVALR